MGLLQGGVLYPTLWIILIHDFPLPLSLLIELYLFADDIAIFLSSRNAQLAQSALQPYLNEIAAWAARWRLSFSVGKCAALAFS